VSQIIGLPEGAFELNHRVSSLTTKQLEHYGVRTGDVIRVVVRSGFDGGKADPRASGTGEMAWALLKELEHSSDPEYCKLCRAMLKVIPSDPVLLFSLTDIPAFLERWQKESHEMCVYQLQMLVNQLRMPEFVSLFAAGRGFEVLAEYLLTDGLNLRALPLVLNVLKTADNDRCRPILLRCVPRLLELFPALGKSRKSVIDLFDVLMDSATQEMNRNFVENEAQFERMIATVDPAASFGRITEGIADKKWLLAICHRHLCDPEEVARQFVDVIKDATSDALPGSVEDYKDTADACLAACEARAPDEVRGALLSIFNTLLKTYKEHLRPLYYSYAPGFFRGALAAEGDDVRRVMLKICGNLVGEELYICLRKEFDIDFDEFDYDPGDLQQKVDGFVGLKNLGVTCFFNAILQQLFYLLQFRSLVLTDQSEELAPLRELFAHLMLSAQGFIDPTAVCDALGIEASEQQDPMEFLTEWLEQLPDDMSKLFRGRIVRKMTAVTPPFEMERSTEFYSLWSDLNGSLDDLLSVEKSQATWTLGDGRSIEVQVETRLAVCPDVLVVQLKRFEWNLDTGNQSKLDWKCEVPPQLDLWKFKTDDEKSYDYELRGVVLHAGPAASGTYSSLIHQWDGWVKFADRDVRECQQFADGCDSRGAGHDGCPYLLFYVRSGGQLDEDFKQLCAPDLIETINAKNREFLRFSTLFDSRLFGLIGNIHDPESILVYFLKIFCHSKLADEYDRLIKTVLDEMLQGPAVELCSDYCNSHFSLLSAIALNCSNKRAKSVFVEFVKHLVNLVHSEKVFPLSKQLFGLLPIAIETNWKEVSNILLMLYPLVKRPDWRALVIDDNWIPNLLSFLATIYHSTRPQLVLQGINLTPLFDLLVHLTRDCRDPSIEVVTKYAEDVVESRAHVQAYLTLTRYLYQCSIITAREYLRAAKICGGDVAQIVVDLAVSGVQSAASEQAADSAMQLVLAKDFKGGLSGFVDRLSGIPNSLLEYPRQVLFPLLVRDDGGIRQKTCRLIKSLFAEPNLPKMAFFHSQLLDFLQATSDHRLVIDLAIAILSWLTTSLDKFDETTFSAIMEIVPKCADDAILLAGFLCDFDPSLIRPNFATLYVNIMRHGLHRPIKIFVEFVKFLPFATLDNTHTILEHETVTRLMEQLPDEPDVFLALLNKLGEFPDDSLCKAKLRDAVCGDFDPKKAKQRLPLLQRGLVKLSMSQTEAILGFVLDSFQAPTIQGAGDVVNLENFDVALQYAMLLFSDRQFVSRFDPLDGPFFAAPIGFVCVQNQRGRVDAIVGILRRLCELYGDDMTEAILEDFRTGFLGDVQMKFWDVTVLLFGRFLLEVCSSSTVVSQQLAAVCCPVAKRSDTESVVGVFAELMGTGEAPEWAKLFFILSAGWLQWGETSFDVQVAERIIPGLTFDQVKEFVGAQYRCQPAGLGGWRVAAMLFAAFPERKEELMQVFPQKKRPPLSSVKTEAVFDQIYD
jgi:hypothetical protein